MGDAWGVTSLSRGLQPRHHRESLWRRGTVVKTPLCLGTVGPGLGFEGGSFTPRSFGGWPGFVDATQLPSVPTEL